ncbi:MAG: peptidylprolyl isomerase, partial [Candidatus Omnitrophota bacterium]
EVNPNAKRIVSKQSLPPGMDINVGSILSIKGPDGGAYPVQVAEIKKDAVVLDLNHPLAGKELHFNVCILEIK